MKTPSLLPPILLWLALPGAAISMAATIAGYLLGYTPHPYAAIWLLGGAAFPAPQAYYQRVVVGYLCGIVITVPWWPV